MVLRCISWDMRQSCAKIFGRDKSIPLNSFHMGALTQFIVYQDRQYIVPIVVVLTRITQLKVFMKTKEEQNF